MEHVHLYCKRLNFINHYRLNSDKFQRKLSTMNMAVCNFSSINSHRIKGKKVQYLNKKYKIKHQRSNTKKFIIIFMFILVPIIMLSNIEICVHIDVDEEGGYTKIGKKLYM